MSMINRRSIFAVLAGTIFAGGILATAASAADEEVIRAVTFTPAQVIYAQQFQKFVDKVNEKGKGVVRIDVIGGPEVIPPMRLGESQKNGVADMFDLPAGLYLNMVPEGEVFAGSNHKPWENRENGGLAMVNDIFHEKGNAHILAHVDAGTGFHLFLTRKPEMTDDGNVDLQGFRIRTSPLYRAFVESLGATNVVQSPTEVYTSLERGVVDGTGYTIVGLRDFNWNKFVQYRIDPGFFQTDVLISMNYDKWQGLSDKAKAILDEVAVEWERESYDIMLAATEAEDKALREAGMEVIELTGTARENYLKSAYDVSWSRLKERDPTHYDALREKFFTPIE